MILNTIKTEELLDTENLLESTKYDLAKTFLRSTNKLAKDLNLNRNNTGLMDVDIREMSFGSHNVTLQSSISTRTAILEKVKEDILVKKQPDIVLKIENNILLSEMDLIDNITTAINKHEYDDVDIDIKRKNYNPWRELRKQYEHQYRRISLTKPSNIEEFEANLRWIAVQGEGEDLIAIQKIKEQKIKGELPYKSKSIENLLETAETEIIKQEQKKGTIFGKYRIFVNQDEPLDKICTAIKIESVYPAFSVILATETTAKELLEFYPIEQLARFDNPQAIIGQSIQPELKIDPIMKHYKIDPNKIDPIMQHYLVVKFDTPIPKNWKELIKGTQAEVVQSIGRSEVIVSVDDEDIEGIVDRITSLDEVKKVSKHEPKIQVQTQYLQKKSEQPVTKEEIAAARLQAARSPQRSRNKIIPIPGILIASFFTEAARNSAAHNLEYEGIRIADKPGNTKLVLDVSTHSNPVDTIEIIRQQPGVRSLQEKIVPTLFNNKACNVIGEKVIPSNPKDTNLGLTGEGEIVAVADTGLDTGNIETLHLDFQGRVEMIQPCPITAFKKEHIENFEEEDASDKYSGHGTHVAGSILGNGEQAKLFDKSFAPTGMAPKAKLIFQAIEKTLKWTSEGEQFYWQEYQKNPPRSGLFGIPDELKDLFEVAYNQGARIHSDSWGGGIPGYYDQKCVDLDEFIWNNKEFLVIVAVGNDGEHTSSGIPGIDQGSITSPAVAKNCLTVGASENKRKGQFSDTYGLRKPYNFPYPPFNDDNMVDCIDDIAAFSSRGPCEDGRRKPDLVAPGTFILSTRSSQIASNNFAEGYYSPAKDYYMYMSGTSMATPLVAGSAALVRQYLREKRDIKNPSAALVKATLIHSAQYMGYRYRHPCSAPWADNEQGWGRVNLCTVLNPTSPNKVIFIDNSEGLATGDKHEYKVEITDEKVPLRATLVYTDYPGEEGRIEQLVNNLNLTLYPPNDKYREASDFSTLHFCTLHFKLCLENLAFPLVSLIHLQKWDAPKCRRYYQGNDFENTGKIDNCNNVEGCIIKPPQVMTGIWTVTVAGSDVPEAPQDYALVVSGGNLKLLQS